MGSAILMVNRDAITAEEMLRRIRPQLEATALTYDEGVYKRRAEEILSNTIRDMISEQLLYQEIAARITEEQNPVVEKAVDKEVNNIATLEAGGSKILLEKMLAEHGSNMEELRKQMRKQIVTQAIPAGEDEAGSDCDAGRLVGVLSIAPGGFFRAGERSFTVD